mmetsp:Transcript_39955/g.46752  ORF Transcript_39955/g.46752 Transcript_39955/m.46752 type:complete len:215 (+) Transcript_39955:189-833(+)
MASSYTNINTPPQSPQVGSQDLITDMVHKIPANKSSWDARARSLLRGLGNSPTTRRRRLLRTLDALNDSISNEKKKLASDSSAQEGASTQTKQTTTISSTDDNNNSSSSSSNIDTLKIPNLDDSSTSLSTSLTKKKPKNTNLTMDLNSLVMNEEKQNDAFMFYHHVLDLNDRIEAKERRRSLSSKNTSLYYPTHPSSMSMASSKDETKSKNASK